MQSQPKIVDVHVTDKPEINELDKQAKTTGVSGVVQNKLFPDMDTMRSDLEEILKESDYLCDKIVPKLIHTFAGKEKSRDGVAISLMLAIHDVTNGMDETTVISLK